MKRLVLLGGGHSHVAVLKSQGAAPMPDARLSLVSARRYTPYSGMLPGLIAGHYEYHQCHIDLERLAGYARAGLRAHAKKEMGRVTGVYRPPCPCGKRRRSPAKPVLPPSGKNSR